MNPVEKRVRTFDAWQQRHRIPAFAYAVFKKFGDDQAGNHVALLTYFALLATFPLLLVLTAILGLVLKGNPALQISIQNSALTEFPIIGNQINSQIGLSSLGHSAPTFAVGILGAILGGRGLANAVQNMQNTLWNVPKVNRPGFPFNYLRSLALLGLLGVGTVVTAIAAWLTGVGQGIGLTGFTLKILTVALSTSIGVGLFFTGFRISAAKIVASKDLILGAFLSSVAWQILLNLAGIIVSHDLKHAQAVAGFFGVVLGLVAWFGLQATAIVYAIEADVVRAHHLWPRSIIQPPLTQADREYLIATASVERRRYEEKITIEFTE